jgi:hypothetical protein
MPQAWREAATAALASVILGAVILADALMLLAGRSYGGSYPGQWAAYSDDARAWFKAVRSPRGVPCCNIADGHITRWRSGEVGPQRSGYEVPIGLAADGKSNWVPVPPEAVIENAKKPDEVEESVVWYVDQGGYTDEQGEHRNYFIRCFVPGDGA